MKTKLFYVGRPINDFKSLVESYKISEFSSPRRSTVPLLIYWKNLKNHLYEFYGYLNLIVPASVNALFEYAVPVQRGKGKASYTDLMLLSKEHVVGIEAKYTEPPYDSVKKWLGNPFSENKNEVLNGWLALIKNATNVKLSPENVLNSAYQLIHRTASVCYPKSEKRAVVYQCFDLDDFKENYYHKQLSNLSELIGYSDKLKFFLIIHPLCKRNTYRQLVELWENGERDLSNKVKQGILEDALLAIGEPKVIRFN